MTQSPAIPHQAHHVSGLGDAVDSMPLKVLGLDERVYGRALDCVHCGLCLPACPTYTQNGLETDSPRGRIHLIKGLADGRVELTDAVHKHLDLCLDCRACETACPSGVVYHELIEEARTQLAPLRKGSLSQRLIEAFIHHVFPYPVRLKLVLLPAIALQRIGLWKPLTRSFLTRFLPAQLVKMQRMLPDRRLPWWEKPITGTNQPKEKHMSVALLTGCVGSVLYQDVNRQAVELLTHLGCEVRSPVEQTCCGAIHHHAAAPTKARSLARQNIDALLPGDDPRDWPDWVVTNIAGCGAMLHEYDHLLRDDEKYRDKAAAFALRVRDVTEVLVTLAPPPPGHEVNLTVTYHDACHLAHARKVTAAPRRVLSWVKGLNVITLPESDTCCGAAGTYNLSQPEMATQLAERKLAHIRSTEAEACVTGNVGCAMQIESEAHHAGLDLKLLHPVTILHRAYLGK
ncbi:MAG: 4Fe-4S dicluster domain-containing protein [Phycisphaera sp.]|nr:4Fe-4S dicluster domain-containing protein [Phycisphaera sp.]